MRVVLWRRSQQWTSHYYNEAKHKRGWKKEGNGRRAGVRASAKDVYGARTIYAGQAYIIGFPLFSKSALVEGKG